MLDQSAVGKTFSQDFSYDWRDIILYHLGVGASQEELEYVYEKGLKVLPSFGVIPCFATFKTENPSCAQPVLPTHDIDGYRKEGNLHMDHKLVIHKPLDPNGGRLHIEKKITEVYDRGEKGAKIMIDVVACDEKGEPIYTNTIGLYNRFAGGFGGQKPPVCVVAIPDSTPDKTIESHYAENAPLLYRLTGDTFPLHADPAFAQKCGFERPIIHGLCSFGYACRLLIDELFPHESERLISLETQFRNIAYPGESFIINVWNIGEKEAVFRMLSKATLKPILECGRLTWK